MQHHRARWAFISPDAAVGEAAAGCGDAGSCASADTLEGDTVD